ncbi:TIGR01244 family protein [Sphingorhabdus lutea]|uniref:TIGR01244 family protein n=1 Tax=Sphingorhabdus lutea TaxID=1913578 RepID=A0A1L3JAC3_9SPHN|nr:TIGR01244 family sulfur transferase [Sphingorhabdus lutea]APG62077.1 TIGR01244 family protein [Sphingorhabdus lutea]
MSDFRKITDKFWVSPQLTLSQLSDAKEMGVTMIVNNRPDGEEPDAPQGDDVAAAAAELGLSYLAIPIGHGGFSHPQLEMLNNAMQDAGQEGHILAYCRSGTRSTFLWSLTQAKNGMDRSEISRLAGNAGYDIAPIAPMVDALCGQNSDM